MARGRDRRVRARRLGDDARVREDHVVVEAPLEVGVQGEVGARAVVGVTLRTPGDDLDLAVGWLAGQGLLRDATDLRGARWCTDADLGRTPGPLGATMARVLAGGTVATRPRVTGDLQRRAATPGGVAPDDDPLPPPAPTSASTGDAVTVDVVGPTPTPRALPRLHHAGCGVCGDDLLDDLAERGAAVVDPGRTWTADAVLALPERLHHAQPTFARTGGLHAALRVRGDDVVHGAEDVGRHNAVDKLVGHGLRTGDVGWSSDALVLSGRVGYELVAKAAVAGCPLVVGVGATSSLAVDVAERFGLTLVAFARDGRATVYAGASRVEA